MKKTAAITIILFVSVSLLINGCASSPTPEPEVAANTQESLTKEEVQPTSTPEPTATNIPTPTPLPGSLVLPLDSFSDEIPWLPYDTSSVPGTYFFFFNAAKPPFNSTLVRQAFASSVDREALVELVGKYTKEVYPATTFTPPAVLGRDLYNQVGLPFNPTAAKELFEQAGYSDPSSFPEITILTNTSGGGTPYLHIALAEQMADTWNEILGVTVNVEYLDWGPYLERVQANPPEIFRLSWAADYNDPDNFLRALFETNAEHNWGYFSNSEFDNLVQEAAELSDPADRQELYLQAERIISETEAGMIPIYHSTWSIE